MGRTSYTIIRIGLGLTTLAALSWVLWPVNWAFLTEPEPLFVFVCALSTWIYSEFNHSSLEVVESSTGAVLKSKTLDETDFEIINRFSELFTPRFQLLLETKPFPKHFHAEHLDSMYRFSEFSNHPGFGLSDEELDKDIKSFAISLNHLLRVGVYAFDRPAGNIVDVRPEIYAIQRSDIELVPRPNLSDDDLVWRRLEEEAKDCLHYGNMLIARLRKVDAGLSREILRKHHS